MNLGILYQICILLGIEIHWSDLPGKVICKLLKHLGEALNERSQENISSRSSTSHISQKSRIEELEKQLEAKKRVQELKDKYRS
jgi:hypothetical protein